MNTSKYDRAARPMLEPDTVLPAQFFATVPSGVLHKTGEHRLLWAVFADAISCFQKFAHATTGAGRQLFDEAEWWIMHQEIQATIAGDATEEPFGFEEVCAALGLDANYVRAGLRRWREAQISARASRGRAADGCGSEAVHY